MIKIAGVKSNDKINFKEFVDFFYKVDWSAAAGRLGRNFQVTNGLFDSEVLYAPAISVEWPNLSHNI